MTTTERRRGSAIDTEPLTVSVSSSGRDYPVLIRAGLLGALPALLSEHCPAERYAIITDHTVAGLYGSRLQETMGAAGTRTDLFAFRAGEASKTRETWAGLTDRMLAVGFGRDAAVVALGGGVAGDLGGFVAATYMRGIPYVQVPTSLLAMIDASVGGKTGVDTAAGKNLVGAFHAPLAVFADPAVLGTLPEAHMRAGLAEAVKHGAILNAEYFAWIEESCSDLLGGNIGALNRLVERSVRIKAEVVSADEREAGRRTILNFGHTIAHAVEQVSGYRVLHGEAVAMGMVAEARLGERSAVTTNGTADRLCAILERIGLQTAPGHSPERIIEATGFDKKARGGRVEYVMLSEIGAVARTLEGSWTHPVCDTVVRDVLNELTNATPTDTDA